MAVYNNMNPRNRRYYYNNRNAMRYNNNNISKPIIQPPTNNDANSDIPPETIPHNNNFSNNNKSMQSILNMFNGLSLDKDKLILLGLMYLLYKEDKSKENFKLLIALGYILI